MRITPAKKQSFGMAYKLNPTGMTEVEKEAFKKVAPQLEKIGETLNLSIRKGLLISGINKKSLNEKGLFNEALTKIDSIGFVPFSERAIKYFHSPKAKERIGTHTNIGLNPCIIVKTSKINKTYLEKFLYLFNHGKKQFASESTAYFDTTMLERTILNTVRSAI